MLLKKSPLFLSLNTQVIVTKSPPHPNSPTPCLSPNLLMKATGQRVPENTALVDCR